MLYIHRSKVICTVLFLLFLSSLAGAQVNKSYNYLDFKKKPYYFGISLGLNSSRYNITQSERFILNDSIAVAESINSPGFTIGVIGNLKIGEFFDFRFIPTFTFSEKRIEYTTTNGGSPYQARGETVYFEAPFLLRYKSKPYKDMRIYALGGFKYTYDIATNSRSRQKEQIVVITPHDYQAEVGIGVQFFMPFFILSPEIKFSHGLGNLLIHNTDLIEASVIEKVFSRTFTISVHFEG